MAKQVKSNNFCQCIRPAACAFGPGRCLRCDGLILKTIEIQELHKCLPCPIFYPAPRPVKQDKLI